MLESGPDTCDHVYNVAMEQINRQPQDQRQFANRIISWMTCTKRELTTFEIQPALAVEAGESGLDTDIFISIDKIVSVYARLVMAYEENSDI